MSSRFIIVVLIHFISFSFLPLRSYRSPGLDINIQTTFFCVRVGVVPFMLNEKLLHPLKGQDDAIDNAKKKWFEPEGSLIAGDFPHDRVRFGDGVEFCPPSWIKERGGGRR